MNLNSKKRKKTHCILEVENTKGSYEDDEPSKKSKSSKKIWDLDMLFEHMKPTAEEIRYRKQKIELDNHVEKYSRYFKCTKCQLNFRPITENIEKLAIHSWLKVLFCKDCLDFYEDGEFSVDSDGEEKYCRWCGEGGLIFSCSECVCGFCTSCIKRHFGVKYNNQVKRKNNWKCFLCFPKPLWFLRFICSIVEEETNFIITVPTPKPKSGNFEYEDDKNVKAKDCTNIKTNSTLKKFDSKNLENREATNCNSIETSSTPKENVSKKFGNKEPASCSVILSDIKESLSEVKVLDTPALKKKIKRKRIICSSSDESDDVVCTQSLKKIKRRENLEGNLNKRSSNQNSLKPEILDKLEKILRLAEYQMGFGVSWSSKMLTKLYKANSLNTSEDIKNDCQKIKWFFSILSTYLVESCASVDLIEKSIESNDQKIIPSPDKSQQGDYSTVVKFLDFVTNQVKVFLEKGIRLQDLLEGEVYYDSQIIGIKVKSNASTSSSGVSETENLKNKLKSNESRMFDNKMNSGDKTSDDESILPSLDLDEEKDSSEIDDYIEKKLSLSDQNVDYLEEAEDQKSKIQEILSILENA